MKKMLKAIILLALYIAPTHVIARTIDFQIIDSLINEPIENVYVYDSKKEFISVSDKNGMCRIDFSESTMPKSLQVAYISHIGYVGKVIILNSLIDDHPVKVLLKPITFALAEVTVSPPNADNIVMKAIKNIPKNYPSIKGDTLAFDLNFIFLDNLNGKIADFKGNVAITNNEEGVRAAKYGIERNSLGDSFSNYGNEVSPSGFYACLLIQSHAPLRLYKKMSFHYDDIVTYNNNDAYKISFTSKDKHNNLSGYMLINTKDYAVVYITYKIGEIEKWITAIQKLSGGIVYTNLKECKVSAFYVENRGGYQFLNGSMNMLFDRTKKQAVLSNNTYDMSIKAIEMPSIPSNLTYLKINELFRKK